MSERYLPSKIDKVRQEFFKPIEEARKKLVENYSTIRRRRLAEYLGSTNHLCFCLNLNKKYKDDWIFEYESGLIKRSHNNLLAKKGEQLIEVNLLYLDEKTKASLQEKILSEFEQAEKKLLKKH